MRIVGLFWAAATILQGQAPPPMFTVTDLGILPGKAVSQATAISSNGTVVGYSSTAGYSFGFPTGAAQSWIWANGVQTAMPVDGPTIPLGINGSGQIVGMTSPTVSGYGPTPFFYLDGRYNTPSGLIGPNFPFPEPIAVSDEGTVALTNAPFEIFVTNEGPYQQAGVWANGTLTVLPIPSDCPQLLVSLSVDTIDNPNFCLTRANGISGNGQYVAGYAVYRNQVSFAPTLWTNGQIKTFGKGGIFTSVNNAGQAAGLFGENAVIVAMDGTTTSLGSKWLPAGINNMGWVVGYDKSFLQNSATILPVDHLILPGEANAILWANNTKYNLNTCSCISNSSGWEFDFAYSLNDAGQIVGTGFHNGVETGYLLTPELGAAPPAITAVVNGASFAGAGIAPGEIATAFGTNLTSIAGINLTSGLPLPTKFQTAALMVNNQPVALFAVDNVNGQQQINFQVPWNVASAPNASIAAENSSTTGASISVPVVAAQPGIFNYSVAGETFGAILHADFQLADTTHPAKPGETLLVYCTGLGAVSSPPADGEPGNGQATTMTPTVTIGGTRAIVSFSGLAPGFVGLYQVNVEVPATVHSGNQAVVMESGGTSSNAVLLPVE